MTTVYDTFILNTTENWYESDTQNGLISSTVISVMTFHNVTLENINFWLTNSQMIEFIDRVYFPYAEKTSVTAPIQAVIDSFAPYRESLQDQREKINIQPYVAGSTNQMFLSENVENTAYGSPQRLEVLMSCLMFLTTTTTDDDYLAYPRVKNNRTEQDKYEYYTKILIPGYEYKRQDASVFQTDQPFYQQLINEIEGVQLSYSQVY